jgi:hypothetical protein
MLLRPPAASRRARGAAPPVDRRVMTSTSRAAALCTGVGRAGRRAAGRDHVRSAGGAVIALAAILAEGADFSAVIEWIIDAGKPETTLSAAPRRVLHGSRLNDSGGTESRTPLRFVLPAGALL